MRRLGAAVLVFAALAVAPPARAAEAVDVAVVTGLDISASVLPSGHRRQVAALAAALRSPRLHAVIRRGPTGRIALAVYAWHQHRIVVLPWSVVGTPAEAEAAADAIEARLRVDLDREVRAQAGAYIGRLTDLSRALDHAGVLIGEAPTAARTVVNIVGNGRDNMGEDAAPARDRLLAAGTTVNGLVLDGDADAEAYFLSRVVGGPGWFVLAAESGADLEAVMLRKLLGDLVAELR